MTTLIITLFVCLGLHSTLTCCKSNPIWLKRKKEFQPQAGREVLRAWHYNKSFNEPDSWLLPVSDDMPEPIFGWHKDLDRAA